MDAARVPPLPPMKEVDIRPRDLFDSFLEAARRDVERFFTSDQGLVEIPCPACGGSTQDEAFRKVGMIYVTCRNCGSLYLSPRPSPPQFQRYQREGEAVAFWSDRFYRETADARRIRIYRPRAELLRKFAGHLDKGPHTFVDVGSGYGIFLEEVTRLNLFQNVYGIEPAPHLAEIGRSRGFRIVQKNVEDTIPADVQADVATAFEVIEHVYAPELFLRAIQRILKPGGILVLTTLTISGFDLQVLWDRSKSIHPPHHINLLSVEGIRSLIEACGFAVVECCTPGQLDVDIVANALEEDPTIPVPRFVRTLITLGDGSTREDLQRFLASHALSSHLRCVARRL